MKHLTERPWAPVPGYCQGSGNSLAGRDAELFKDHAGAGLL
jgi:hypothetical protein